MSSPKSPTKLKKNIRTKSLYPANVPKTRKELLDYTPEFLADLKKNHPEEYLYLAQFTDEYVNAAVDKDSKGRVKKGHLHKTKALAKDCYDRNNWRNNDVLGVTKINHLLYNIDDEVKKNDGWYVHNAELTEDSLNAGMDQEAEYLTYAEFKALVDSGAEVTAEMLAFYTELFSED